MFKEKIIIEMKEVFKEIPFGIEHTLKVLKNAEDIMNGENIGEEEKEFISITAILHDIGAVEAQKKYGSIDGVYQEKEGPEVAKEILKKVGYNKNIDRICFIIGNHHTPSKIDGLDFQIQWEADLMNFILSCTDDEQEQSFLWKAISSQRNFMLIYNNMLTQYFSLLDFNEYEKDGDFLQSAVLFRSKLNSDLENDIESNVSCIEKFQIQESLQELSGFRRISGMVYFK